MTKIEWCDATWNPMTGCTPCSAGCENCYAKRMAETRLRGRCGYPADEPFRPTFHADKLGQPLKWKKPKRIFVNSMSDIFHPDFTFEQVKTVYNVMRMAHWHTFIVLTKRPERFRPHLPGNVWLGVTVENQQAALERIPRLLKIPVKRRFLSMEPLLESVSLRRWLVVVGCYTANCPVCGWIGSSEDCFPSRDYHDDDCRCPACGTQCDNDFDNSFIDWVICGGENGRNARPFDEQWAVDIQRDCERAKIPFFYKGSGGKNKNRLLRGKMYEEFPEVNE